MRNNLTKIAFGACLIVVSALSFAEEKYVVGFAQDTLGNDWRLAQVMAVKKELEKYPHIKFIYTDGKGETAIQASQIESLVDDEGIDLLITSPREESVLSDIIASVYKKGTPVVLLDRGIEGDNYTSFIHPDNYPIGVSAGKYLAEKLGGKGHVLMLEGVQGATPTIHRTNGFLKVMENYQDIKITRRVANYLRADAIMAVEELLSESVKFDAIYAQSDSMATGARMALEINGVDPASLVIVGIDYIKEAQEAILNGKQSVSYTYPTGGKEGAEVAVDILQGKAVAREIIIDSVEVTKENAALVQPIF